MILNDEHYYFPINYFQKSSTDGLGDSDIGGTVRAPL